MTAYLIGNLLGRLLMSWLIVFLVVLLRQRGRFRIALRRNLWPWGWIPVGILFVLGILGTVLAHH